MERNDKPHFSFSQLSMYMRCSMQWFFRYVEGRKERPSLPMKTGQAGHTALQWQLQRKMAQKDTSLPDLLDMFSTAHDAETYELEAGDLKPGEDVGKAKDSATETLRFYHQKTAPTLRPIAVESSFTLEVPATEDYEYPIKVINGRIDLIEPDGLTDHKWTARKKSQGDIDLSDQHTLYDTVLSRSGIEIPSLNILNYLPATTKEGARVIKISRSPEYMTPTVRQGRRDRLMYKLRTVARAISAGIYLPTDNPITCSWCGYRDRCQFNLVKSDYEALMIRQRTGETNDSQT